MAVLSERGIQSAQLSTVALSSSEMSSEEMSRHPVIKKIIFGHLKEMKSCLADYQFCSFDQCYQQVLKGSVPQLCHCKSIKSEQLLSTYV